MLKISAFVCLLIFTVNSYAQIVLEGRIVDNKGKSVSYASVLIKNTHKGVATNEFGYFKFYIDEKYKDAQLEFSSIGYQPAYLGINQIINRDSIYIVLKEETTSLDSIVLSENAGKEFLQKVIENIPNNYPQKAYSYTALYRQVHREDAKYVRLIEAYYTIYDSGYKNLLSTQLKERLKLNELRKSEDFERNGEPHGDHVTDLFLENPIHYYKNSVFNTNAFDYTTVRFEHIDSLSSKYFILRFKYQNDMEPKIQEGTLFINKGDYAVEKLIIKEYANPAYLSPRHLIPSNWKFVSAEKQLEFKKIGEYYYLDRFNYSYSHQVFDEFMYHMKHETDEYFSLYVEKIGEKPESFRQYSAFGSLYRKRYTYNKEFWNNFGLLKLYPTKPDVISDLEREIDIETQFLNGR